MTLLWIIDIICVWIHDERIRIPCAVSPRMQSFTFRNISAKMISSKHIWAWKVNLKYILVHQGLTPRVFPRTCILQEDPVEGRFLPGSAVHPDFPASTQPRDHQEPHSQNLQTKAIRVAIKPQWSPTQELIRKLNNQLMFFRRRVPAPVHPPDLPNRQINPRNGQLDRPQWPVLLLWRNQRGHLIVFY